jgi:hypothetical protein
MELLFKSNIILSFHQNNKEIVSKDIWKIKKDVN